MQHDDDNDDDDTIRARRATRPITLNARAKTAPPGELNKVLDGRYELLHEVGRGGMSIVHAGRDRLLERTVAIKMLNVELTESAHAERLRREAAAMARIDSPHVVSIHDIGLGAGGMYLVMQYIHGSTIEQEIERFGTAEPARAVRIALDILAGLTAVHSCGFVHRDLKPSNVMLDRDDRAVLLDLGVALHRRKAPMTPPGISTGTPEFMAPEQLDTGSGALDGRTDLYQLGRILVYVSTGLDAESDIPAGLARMPKALARVARQALAPLGMRYSSTEQMRAALLGAEQELQRGDDVVTEQIAVVPPPPPPRRQWRTWPVILASIATLFNLS